MQQIKKIFFILFLLFINSISAQYWFQELLLETNTNSKLSAYFKNASKEEFDAYKTLQTSGSKYVKINPTYLEKFSKLSPENQAKIALFTDDKAGSTLTKFLDECDDAAFLKFVNDTENSKFVDAFINHKQFTDNDAQNIGDLVAELRSQNFNTITIEKWLERSDKISIMKGRFKIAADFEKANNTAIRNNLSPPCNSWGGNGDRTHYTQLQVGEPKVI